MKRTLITGMIALRQLNNGDDVGNVGTNVYA